MSPDTGNKRIPASPTAKKSPGTRALNAVKRQKPEKVDASEEPVTKKNEPEAKSEAISNGEEHAADAPSNVAEALADELVAQHGFGERRLDALLGGGLKAKASAVLYGPPYMGKEHLARMYVVESLLKGLPSILIHTDKTAQDEMEYLEGIHPDIAKQIEKGLLQMVDCYSRAIDAPESKAAHVHYVDGPADLNGISVAVNTAQKKFQADHLTHTVALDSLSTLIAYSDAPTAFRFMQVLLGKSALLGASPVVLLDDGMHTPEEVQTFRHLTTGTLELRDAGGKTQIRVLGISSQEGLNWIDYRYHEGDFEITGSFAPGRIR